MSIPGGTTPTLLDTENVIAKADNPAYLGPDNSPWSWFDRVAQPQDPLPGASTIPFTFWGLGTDALPQGSNPRIADANLKLTSTGDNLFGDIEIPTGPGSSEKINLPAAIGAIAIVGAVLWYIFK